MLLYIVIKICIERSIRKEFRDKNRVGDEKRGI